MDLAIGFNLEAKLMIKQLLQWCNPFYWIERRRRRLEQIKLKSEIRHQVNFAKAARAVLENFFKKAKAGRNDPCSCGSGRKYKKCCGKNK